MIKFLVNSMLGSMAKKLRICGFDTVYKVHLKDDDLIEMAKEENRILLTSDEELSLRALKRGVRSILIKGKNDEDRLVELFKALDIKDLYLEIIRCPLCNGELYEVEKEEVKNKVFPSVYKQHNKFYLCKRCGKIYWEGSHWEKIIKFFDKVNNRLRGEEVGNK